jgi:hypothetical protein
MAKCMKAGEETHVVPRTRDAAFDIREEFGSRAARGTRLYQQTAEERVGSKDTEKPTEDGAPAGSPEDANG